MSFAQTADSQTLYAYAIAAMFASLLPWGLVGAIVGRATASFEAGLGTAMLLFGITGLMLGAGVGWIVLVQSEEVTGHAAGCTTLEPPGEATVLSHRDEYVARLPGGVERRLATPPRPGPCPAPAAGAEPGQTELPAAAPPQDATLRVRRAALSAGAGTPSAEVVNDARRSPVMVGVFGAFGGFWFLGGLALVASRREGRDADRSRGAGRDDAPAPGPRRRGLATAFTALGNFVLLGAILVAVFADWDGARATQFSFRGVASSCVCHAVAMALRRTLTLSAALVLLIVGGGFALAAWSLLVLG